MFRKLFSKKYHPNPWSELRKAPVVSIAEGFDVSVCQLFQYETYSGFLEGYPNAWSNKLLFARTLQDAEEKIWCATQPFAIPPKRKTFRVKPIGGERQKVEFFPSFTCIAHLEHTEPVRDKTQMYSCLIVVWWQDTPVFPIEQDILEQMNIRIRWNKHAEDASL